MKNWDSDIDASPEKAQEVIAAAKADGMEVVHSDSKTLLLDIDNGKKGLQWLDAQLKVFNHEAPTYKLQVSEKYTSSGGGLHVIVESKRPISIVDRLLLQAVLGSDLRRELISYLKYLGGVEDADVSVLFKPNGVIA